MAKQFTLKIKRQALEPLHSIFQGLFVASPTPISASRIVPHGQGAGRVGGDADILLRMDARKSQHRGTRRRCNAQHFGGSHRAGQHQGWQQRSASLRFKRSCFLSTPSNTFPRNPDRNGLHFASRRFIVAGVELSQPGSNRNVVARMYSDRQHVVRAHENPGQAS